jgi:hypothetical protein
MSDRTGAVISEQTFGETVADAYGVPFCLAADGKWYRADASDPLLSRGDMALCVETSVVADGEGRLLKYGWIRRTGWTWTLGQPVYFGATPGTLTQTKPVGNTIRYAGYPAAADALWFSPTDPVLAEFLSLELPPGVEGDYLYHNGLAWIAHPLDPLPEGTRGDLLYHNGVAWAPLAPGTEGQVLQTGGPDADPAWADPPAGGGGDARNWIINGNFDIWQRGTSFVENLGSSSTYVADRFRVYAGNHSSDFEVSRGTVSPPLGSQYYLYYKHGKVGGITPGHGRFVTILEGDIGAKLAGQQVTFSFKYKIPTNFSSAWNFAVRYDTDDSTLSGNVTEATGTSMIAATPLANSPDWALSSHTVTVPAGCKRIALIWYSHNNSVNGAEFELSQVNLNIGDKPLPFAPRPYAEELALCQRYYRTWTQQTENGRIYVPLWPPMRVAPTMTASAGTTSNITAAGFNLTHNAQATTTITASSEL